MKALETKIPPPVIALAFATLIWWMASYLPKVEIEFMPKVVMVSLLLALGAFFDLSGLLKFLKAKTTINPMKPHTSSVLVSTGIYKITRNPMYVGLVFILSGWCIYLNCPAAIIGVVGFIFYIHAFQILPEERILITLFGEEYIEYQTRVRRWL